MRRIALSLALLLAFAGPAAAIDLGRLLPMPDLSLPSWNGGDKPAPPPADAATPRTDVEAPRPGGTVTPDAAAAAAESTAPAPKTAVRPRGWRSLLPGSIK